MSHIFWLAALLTTPTPANGPAFWEAWGDGQAELAGYRLVQPRYGESRQGSVVLIFVAETFSESSRVKADPGRHPKDDEFAVLKLNAVKDFQTGVYDYNLMTSVFAAVEPRYGRRAGTPAKIVFSSQEWCGALFEELLFRSDEIRQARFSYFDGEADQVTSHPFPKNGLSEDELPIIVRGLPRSLLEKGEAKSFPILPSLERSRLLHNPLSWVTGRLERDASQKIKVVPAGSFSIERWTLQVEGGTNLQFFVEADFPHRLVGWEHSDGEKAELLGAKRMKYWEKNREGNEALLRELGFAGPPAPQFLKSPKGP